MRDQYLDLLEKTLTFDLWPEPYWPVCKSKERGFVARTAKLVDRCLSKTLGLRLCLEKQRNATANNRWPLLAHTMVSRARLQNIRKLCKRVVFRGMKGAFVECGVWRGGASIFARACLPSYHQVILCDSFKGLPYDPTEGEFSTYDFLRVPVSEVRQNFINYGQLFNVRFIEGYFEETLPKLCQPICILRCDGDMFSSTQCILNNLYQLVEPGGFVIIDDYSLAPCKRATDLFRTMNKINNPLIPIDEHSCYWQKS